MWRGWVWLLLCKAFPVETEKYWFVLGAFVISGSSVPLRLFMLRKDKCRLWNGQGNAMVFLCLFAVAAVFCDSLCLFFLSPCFCSMCEYIQPSKWRLQKKGKAFRDPNYCFLSFWLWDFDLQKLCDLSLAGVRVTSQENSRWRWFGAGEYQCQAIQVLVLVFECICAQVCERIKNNYNWNSFSHA